MVKYCINVHTTLSTRLCYVLAAVAAVQVYGGGHDNVTSCPAASSTDTDLWEIYRD